MDYSLISILGMILIMTIFVCYVVVGAAARRKANEERLQKSRAAEENDS
ncbi:MAG: hypothetical protein HKN23_17925 [Verrucomicrobiales bacterium]|nr:hypothetical protein [Verrucomicrobiales bacterium]